MKIRKLLSVLLVCILLVCMFISATAWADNSFYLNVGESLASTGANTIYSSPNTIYSVSLESGSLPSGVTVAIDNGKSVALVGSPTVSGTYSAVISVGVQDGYVVSYYAIPVKVNVGTGYNGGSTSTGGVVVVSPNNNNDGTSIVPNASIKTPPTLTKSPTDEKCAAGEDAVFVARADNASMITWYLISPDLNTKYYASSVGNHFVGTTASGTNSERLVLSNISKDLNGWMVEAEFTNNDGTILSSPAYLTVTQEIVPSPTPTASPAPTPSPTPSPIPSPTPTPGTTTYVNGTPVQNGGTGGGFGTTGSTTGNSDTTKIGNDGSLIVPVTTASGIGNGSAGTGKNNHIGAYILAVIAGAVIIGSVLVMALYMKGKISLGKLEQLLGGDNGEMFDDNGEYYNPDDFKGDRKDT